MSTSFLGPGPAHPWIQSGSVEVRSIVDVDFSLWSSSGVMCVLQPAKTAELRQPGIFAHAVKTGGIYIYIYILFSLQASRLFITCCYLVNFSCDLFFHATLTISRLNFKSISNVHHRLLDMKHKTNHDNGHRWWRVKVEFDAARLCSRQ